MTYNQLIENLKQRKVVGGESCAEDLFKAADEIYAAHSSAFRTPFSDVHNPSGNQIIDLVQEGGGMWGIALVGYTYILEKAGLRFNNLAGTSAGAINAMCLAAVPETIYDSVTDANRPATKSQVLTEIIANHDYNDFIDREKGIVRNLLLTAIKHAGLRSILFSFTAIGFIISFAAFYFLSKIFVNDSLHLMHYEIAMYLHLAGTLLAFVPLVIFYMLFRRVLGTNFGLNPGNVPFDFISNILQSCGITDTASLTAKMKSEHFSFPDDATKPGSVSEIKKRLVLIISNLTHNRIVKFPERAADYFVNADIVNPALFVRASMSIPFFFNCVKIDTTDANVKLPARFVDGGMLSNFPIREFHSVTRRTPRFPTFGVRLGINNPGTFRSRISLASYLGSFISTFRGFYDNDFLSSNEETAQLVTTIDTADVNWLNFAMSFKDKKTLFTKGAEAACAHLSKFDWMEYKKLREDLYDKNPFT